MNICFFAHHSISGKDGASLSMLSIAEKLAEGDNNIIIVYPNHPQNISKNEKIKNIYIRSFSMRRNLNDSSLFSTLIYRAKSYYNNFVSIILTRIIKNNKIDLIHINGIDSCIGAQCAINAQIPYVWHIRQFLEEDLHCTLFNKRKIYSYMQKANQIIGISKAVCEKYGNILNRKILLIYNGVDLKKYILPKHAFESEPYVMLLAGRITKEKGQLDAIKALEILIRKGINIKLLLVGYGVGEYYTFVQKYIERHSLEKNVQFLEYTNDLNKIRESSDIGLICSTKEAFGRVTVENFLARIFCIGANTGGTAELIQDGYNGLLYETGDYVDLASKIESVICAKDKKIFDDMIECAFSSAIENYSMDRLMTEIKSVYASVIGQNI